jgi:hypothetical protein
MLSSEVVNTSPGDARHVPHLALLVQHEKKALWINISLEQDYLMPVKLCDEAANLEHI